MALPENAEQAPSSPSLSPSRHRRLRWWMVLAGLVVLVLAGSYGGWQLWGMHHLRTAEKAIARYEFPEALNELECCLRVWPRSVSVRLQAARAARRGDQLKRAEELLSACEKAGITADTALERAMLRTQQGDLAEVEAGLNQLASENHPDTVLIWEATAKGKMQVHDDGRLIVYLWGLVLKKEPDHPAAHFWLGRQLEEDGFLIDSIPSYQRAVQLAPHRDAYRLALAAALLGFSKPSEAWPHYQELLRSSPDQPAVLLGAARCQHALGQLAAAQDYLDRLLRQLPDDPEGWAERGRVYRDQGNRAEALRCLRKAFALVPNNAKIGYTLLNELRGEKESEEAKVVSAKVEQLARESRRMDELTSQLRKLQHSAKMRHELGMICLRIGQDVQAVRWLQGALQDDPGYQPAHAALADYYERNGYPDAAAYHRQHAGSAKP